MRRKIVLWGSNEKDEKLLVALELLEKENLVNIFTFPESVATEEFYKAMSEKWREDEEVEFPTTFTKTERKLSVSDSLLPDEIKVEKTDLINRAQAEWHFIVLSSKLFGMYKSELEEIKERADDLTEFESSIWNELKEFWNKVQGQLNDKNLFREHGAALKERTNLLFDKLKELRKELDVQFESQSKNYAETFKSELKEIEEKISKGLGLSPLFEDLKQLQAKFRNIKFTKADRDELWSKIDDAFKKLKEKRGVKSESSNSNNLARFESRLNGLHGAIQKMERSINYDKRDLEDELKKGDDVGGQLEVQLRKAKIRMIEERLRSKEEKLVDMHLTQKEIETRIDREKKRQVKAEKYEKLEEAKDAVKLKIASDIAEMSKERDQISDKLEQAATEIQTPHKVSFFEKITDSVEQLVEDVVDSAKAVAEVVSGKIDDAKDKIEDIAEAATDMASEIKDKAKDKFEDVADKFEESKDKIEDKFENIVEAAADKASELKAKAKDIYEDVADKLEESKDKLEDKFEDIAEAATDKASELKAKAKDIYEDVADKFDNKKDKAEDKIEDIAGAAADKASEIKAEVKDNVENIADNAEDEIRDAIAKVSGVVDEIEDKLIADNDATESDQKEG